MRRLAVLAIAAACGSPRPVRHEPKPLPRPPVAAHALPGAPTTVLHQTRAVIESPHGGAIVLLTGTPGADAVLTTDENGGVRLWPSLDGKREPKLVELPPAKQLALGHRGDGYVAVARDEVGGLYIAKLDADGRTLAHTTIGADPPFEGMAMSTLGLLAWRADHHVLLVDPDGAIKGDLGTEPQQRIVGIAVQGVNALALLEVEGVRKVRWLTLQPKLAWGALVDVPDQGMMGLAIALAPGLTHFALVSKTDKTGQVGVHEVATGKLVTHDILVGTGIEIDFVDDKLLAIGSREGGLRWLAVEALAPMVPITTQLQPSQQRHLLTAGGGLAILPRDGELMLMTPTDTKFLGYQTLSPQVTAPGPDGKLLVVSHPGAVMLDANLRETASKPLLGLASNAHVAALEWVGGDDWLVESTDGGAKLQIALHNLATGKSTVVRDNLSEVHYLAFEPTTQLVTLSFGAQAQVARLDRRTYTLDQLAPTLKRSAYEEVAFAPLSSALGPNALVEVVIRDKPVARWFKDPKALDKPSATVTLGGPYLGTDAAGTVYAWRPTSAGKLEVASYLNGKAVGTLPTQGPASLWPDPTATMVAEAGPTGITLYKGSAVMWTRATEGVHEVHWLTDGGLAINHVTGVARLDVKTGAVIAVRCGWEFGLSSKPHPPAPRIEPICAQLAR